MIQATEFDMQALFCYFFNPFFVLLALISQLYKFFWKEKFKILKKYFLAKKINYNLICYFNRKEHIKSLNVLKRLFFRLNYLLLAYLYNYWPCMFRTYTDQIVMTRFDVTKYSSIHGLFKSAKNFGD